MTRAARDRAVAVGLAALSLLTFVGIALVKVTGSTAAWFLGLLTLTTLMVVTVLLERSSTIAAAQARRWARAVGWEHLRISQDLPHHWSLPPFGLGHTRRAAHVVHGRFGRWWAASFEYWYSTALPFRATRATYHVVVLHLPVALPTLHLTARDGRPDVAPPGQRIGFESAEFEAAWAVSCEDPRFAHAVITPRLMERLLRPESRGMDLRIEGASVLSWRQGVPDVERITPTLETLRAIAEGIPAFVWREHGAATATGAAGGPGFPVRRGGPHPGPPPPP